MLNFRTNLRIVVAIVACLAVTTMFASCDKDKDGDGGGSSTLNANEKELAGAYSYGKVPTGFYAAWKSNGTVVYEQWSSSLPLDMRIYVFQADGNFSSVEYSYSGNQNLYSWNKIIYTKAKWSVTSDGTISFTNIKETVDDIMAPGQSYNNKTINNRKEYYMHETDNGKKGIRIDSYSLDEISTANFFEKIE